MIFTPFSWFSPRFWDFQPLLGFSPRFRDFQPVSWNFTPFSGFYNQCGLCCGDSRIGKTWKEISMRTRQSSTVIRFVKRTSRRRSRRKKWGGGDGEERRIPDLTEEMKLYGEQVLRSKKVMGHQKEEGPLGDVGEIRNKAKDSLKLSILIWIWKETG